MIEKDIALVVETAVSGNNEAFETLFSTYWNMAYFYCFKYLKNESEAEDAAQDAFFTLFKNIQNLNKPNLFVAYFSRILTNTCHNHYKRHKRKNDNVMIFDDNVIETLSEERMDFLPEVTMAQRELRAEIMKLIDELPKKQREVMLLHFLNDLSQSEIAAVLNVKPSVIGNRLFHAKAALKQKFENIDLEGIKYAAGLPISIITQALLQEQMLVATPAIQARAWGGLQTQINAYSVGDTPKNSSSSSNPGLIAAACAAAVCLVILGANYYNHTRRVEPEDTFCIVEELRAVEELGQFNEFVARHNFNTAQVATWNTPAGEVQYRLYQRALHDMTIFTGIRSSSSEFLIVYELAPLGTAPPQDVAVWINRN